MEDVSLPLPLPLPLPPPLSPPGPAAEMRELDTGELVHQKVRIDNPLGFGPLREATVLVDAAAGMAYEKVRSLHETIMGKTYQYRVLELVELAWAANPPAAGPSVGLGEQPQPPAVPATYAEVQVRRYAPHLCTPPVHPTYAPHTPRLTPQPWHATSRDVSVPVSTCSILSAFSHSFP